jgi:hypothetical protein
MPLIESALLSLGESVSKALFASWLRGRTPGARSDESVEDLLRRRVPQTLQRRRTERQFDQVADRVTEKLHDFLETEYRNVSENELTAAALLVRDLFQSVERDPSFLLQADLDALKIENALRKAGAEKIHNALLSQAGTFVFNSVLRETAAYVIEVFTALPDFQAKATKEILRRETALVAMVEQVLSKLPTSTDNRNSDSATFETYYRRSMALKLDQLELFGATLSEYSRRYALSVAYISLMVASAEPQTESPHSTKMQSPPPEAAADPTLRVETTLGYGSQRVLIRGDAGSGKTTLLQWLAVAASRRELPAGLNSWNDLIPVYLPLRRYAKRPLPRPDEFLNLMLPNLAGIMPDRWMHELLQSARALMLLDGLDELPAARREEFKGWFDDLLRDFPDVAVVLTSRPTAADKAWFHAKKIQAYDLQPMSLQDIKSLIDHWHMAVTKDLEDEDELKALDRYPDMLKDIIEDRRPIRTLASNPLMCALICALHRDRRTHLPRDRMELYRIALEMLLERRDRERKVAEDDEAHLSYREKELLLEDLAYWLIRNGQSDATVVDATIRIDAMLPNITRVSNAADVLTYLIERSGVIRSPVEGRVDFVHRSFQEFLAAKAAVQGADIPLLLHSADDDQWREVIILAAGHARPSECERLIKGLLERGSRKGAGSHRLTLLAMACLETAAQLSPELRAEVTQALGRVVPPKTASDAAAIAAAGELATPFLTDHVDARPLVVAACVRALALIGGEASMKAIAQYAADKRPAVGTEVIKSWSMFPADLYAKRVLSTAPLVQGAIELSDRSYIEYLPLLKHLRRIYAERLDKESLRALGRLQRVRHLVLSRVDLDDFFWLTNASTRALELKYSSLYSWEGICEGASGLAQLSLEHCTGSMVGSLGYLPRLAKVEMYNADVHSLRFLESCAGLRKLSIRECPNLTSLRGISHFRDLEEIALEDNIGLYSISELTALPKLQCVTMAGAYVEDLSPLLQIRSLRSLHVSGVEDGSSLRDLSECGVEVTRRRESSSPSRSRRR